MNEKLAIPVTNSGLVIIQGFVEKLFDHLRLVKDGKFISEKEQDKAIHVLQFFATGQDKNSDEYHLLLNKILCGKSLESTIDLECEIDEKDKELIDSLLKAVMDYWPSNGSSTNDGFRGNWMIRNGTITEKNDRWNLIVEKRAYDILLHQSPFSFSIIKFKWMSKPLYVTWDY